MQQDIEDGIDMPEIVDGFKQGRDFQVAKVFTIALSNQPREVAQIHDLHDVAGGMGHRNHITADTSIANALAHIGYSLKYFQCLTSLVRQPGRGNFQVIARNDLVSQKLQALCLVHR